MAFTYTITRRGVDGTNKVVEGTWTATGVTTGSVVTGMRTISNAFFVNKTGARADTAVDTTTTAGTATISGVTANDTGTFKIEGK